MVSINDDKLSSKEDNKRKLYYKKNDFFKLLYLTERVIYKEMEKDLKNAYHMYNLVDWIDIERLDWKTLSSNPNAIYLLEQNPRKID